MAPFFSTARGRAAAEVSGFTHLRFDEGSAKLLTGRAMSPGTVAIILTAVAGELRGPDGILIQHFKELQSAGPKLSPEWLKDKRKSGSGGKIFVQTGTVYKAISTKMGDGGEMRQFGSSADRYSNAPKKLRIARDGIYVNIDAANSKGNLTAGFVGRMGYSSAFNKLRKDLASDKLGHRASAKEASRAVSVGAVDKYNKSFGQKGYRKYERVGSLGFRGEKVGDRVSGVHALARGKQNLGYANIVQSGVFKGVKATDGHLVKPGHAAALRKTGRGKDLLTKETVYGVGRPLMPFKNSDEARIARTIEKVLVSVILELDSHHGVKWGVAA